MGDLPSRTPQTPRSCLQGRAHLRQPPEAGRGVPAQPRWKKPEEASNTIRECGNFPGMDSKETENSKFLEKECKVMTSQGAPSSQEHTCWQVCEFGEAGVGKTHSARSRTPDPTARPLFARALGLGPLSLLPSACRQVEPQGGPVPVTVTVLWGWVCCSGCSCVRVEGSQYGWGKGSGQGGGHQSGGREMWRMRAEDRLRTEGPVRLG